LAADAAELVAADHLGVDLAHEVHLQGRVDGNHVLVLADDGRIVGIVHGLHEHVGVVVDEIVELARAHEEGSDELARIDCLLAVRDDSGLGQGHNAVGEHLRVDA